LKAKSESTSVSTPSSKKRMLDFDIEPSSTVTVTPSKTLVNMSAIVATPKYKKHSSMQTSRFRSLILMIIKCMLPISLVERQPFKDFILKLDPSFNMPTRYLVKSNGIPDIRKETIINIKNAIFSIPWPNISLDGWSDGIMRCFSGYALQGIDKNWNLVNLTLAFRHIKGRFWTLS
jgi:hypothetical protein